ncbi:protein SUPPRESSOR OF PHYA-105 1-like isoform X4 [Abrus precatorius]|uniref:Protein SUPPRESSOR OF PHYA-105 1-like isoform X4 n=1 Tax=Abrus precatorius TaxID=3816 RepID=A0A8B8JZ19_ABRPR|nr:protein SUPPRESSOR OF PHYA-105 1-like isoform X4 [Abrus precatorius]
MTTANGGAGTEEHKRKTNDPFLKSPGHQNMPKSPRLCTPIRKEWPESLPNDNTIGNEDNGLNRYVTSLAGSGPPGTNFCSTIDSEHIVEELPVRNYKNQNIDVVNHPHNSRQPLRNQLAIESKYNSLSREIVPKVELQIPLKLSKGLKGIDSEIWGLKSLPLKVSADISNRNKTITSSNAHLNSSKTHNTLSAYNCPQLVAEQTVKGKGVICKDLDKNFGLGGVLMSQEDEKPAFATKLQHDTLLRPNVVDNNPSLKETAVMCAESSNDALNLREWIKSEDHIMKKSVRLQIFKQILEMVDFAHSQGNVLKDLKPSCFSLLPSSKIKYIGSYGHRELDNEVMKRNVTWKRPLEQDIGACQSLSTKQQKLCEETGSFRQQHHFTCIHGSRTMVNQTDSDTNGSMESRNKESLYQNDSSHQCTYTDEKQYMSVTIQLEDKWYCSPEVLNGGPCTFSSNIYSLGVLLFELLCNIESWEAHSTMMLDLSCRILPPKFLSENPKEAGFCLWLLHPEPSSRPITRMILESEFICESEESSSGEDVVVSDDDETETEQLIHFLISLKEEKKKQAAKLEEQLNCLNEDIKGMWDADTGQPLSQYMEHQKRAWSVHFSLADPKMFASGSDDCSVKLWNISERNSMGTIWNPANICCVQFSAYSTNLLFFGSADYKVYGYDLRHTRIPWCTLSGHGKAVSYVKFIDAETVVSASTDNSLKLWDLNKTSSSALSSDACVLTFKGHSNEKNFVGLSVLDGYIACGSESNEVYCYHKSLPVPIATHKFESIDSIYGHPNSGDNRGQFVSSVCWRKKSNMLVAANSVGIVKLLQMV